MVIDETSNDRFKTSYIGCDESNAEPGDDWGQARCSALFSVVAATKHTIKTGLSHFLSWWPLHLFRFMDLIQFHWHGVPLASHSPGVRAAGTMDQAQLDSANWKIIRYSRSTYQLLWGGRPRISSKDVDMDLKWSNWSASYFQDGIRVGVAALGVGGPQMGPIRVSLGWFDIKCMGSEEETRPKSCGILSEAKDGSPSRCHLKQG